MYTVRGVAPLFIVLIVVASVALLTSGYTLYSSYNHLQDQLSSTTLARATLADELSVARAKNTAISQQLASEMAKSGTLETKVNDVVKTVNTLTKLSQTDKELLQKYSRVYFLNEKIGRAHV